MCGKVLINSVTRDNGIEQRPALVALGPQDSAESLRLFLAGAKGA